MQGLRSKLAIQRERGKVAKSRAAFLRYRRPLTDDEITTFAQLSAADQALSWALDDFAMAPSRCYPRKARK